MHDLFSVTQPIDNAWLAVFHAHTNAALDWIAWVVSLVGWAGACWWLLAGVLWMRGYRFLAAQLVLSLVLAAAASELLKHAVHRLRPAEIFPQMVQLPLPNLYDSRWSFPSGHEALAAAAAFCILFATHRAVSWWLVGAALLVGWARLYQGVHWPSDVLFGLVIGIIAALAAIAVSSAFAGAAMFDEGKRADVRRRAKSKQRAGH